MSQKTGTIKDLAALLPAAENVAGDTLPQVTAGGALTMTYRQLNADGAGPVTCQVSANAADGFQSMQVTTNVPGDNGRSNVVNTNFVSILSPWPCGENDFPLYKTYIRTASRGADARRRHL
jgi:Egh16-like virulence factor